MGTPVDLASSFGGYVNRQLPIYFDVQNYASYNIRISYQQLKVDNVTDHNQIKISETPAGNNILNFTASSEVNTNLITSWSLRISGNGEHYIQNGNFGVGTTSPDEKTNRKRKNSYTGSAR